MTETTTPPAPEPPVRRLHRSQTDRVIGGVCGGIAEYFRIDPVIVRVAAVALIVAGGAGVLLYLAALLLVPKDGEEGRPPGRVLTIAGVILIAIAVGGLFSFHGGGWFFLPIVLLGVAGIFAWQLASGERADGDTRSLLRAAGLGGALLVGCLVLALGSGWAAAVGGGGVVAGAVILAGVVLVAGAVMGRRTRWLILPALAIAVPAGVVSAAGIDGHGGIGDKVYRPTSSAALQPSYRVGVGRVQLDLRGAHLTPGDHVVTLKAGIGAAELVVPRDVCVTTKAHMGVGGVQVFDRSSGGIDVDWQDGRTAKPGVARIVLDGDVGVGGVIVTDIPDDNSHTGNLGCA
ncbi:MAG: PspC domain-containing protein [Actinomycetota bacterium]|nr:PspC domain-containing protein [Actinomycetota bacterium]